jgi:hypothetical protein
LTDISTKEVIDFEDKCICVKETESIHDQAIHKILYKYLSDFVHPNMVSSGWVPYNVTTTVAYSQLGYDVLTLKLPANYSLSYPTRNKLIYNIIS